MFTVEEFAKKFDLAWLAPDAQKEDIIKACQTAAKYKVNSINVNSHWIETCKKELEGTGVGYSAVIGFPYGACTTETKLFELEQMVKAGCSACDMVINIGAMKDGDYDLVEYEVKKFVEICGDKCETKLIFEVGFLTIEQIEKLTQICCAAGVDYVKTATGSQAFPDLDQVKAMKRNLSGHTKIKVSGVPRTFTLAAAMYLFEHEGVGLIGTRTAGKVVDQYKRYLEEINQ